MTEIERLREQLTAAHERNHSLRNRVMALEDEIERVHHRESCHRSPMGKVLHGGKCNCGYEDMKKREQSNERIAKKALQRVAVLREALGAIGQHDKACIEWLYANGVELKTPSQMAPSSAGYAGEVARAALESTKRHGG